MIFDIRPIFDTHYIANHNLIANRSEADSHPMTSITGLLDKLATKPDVLQMNTELASKADSDGTSSAVFTLNTAHTGAPASDISIEVNRGSESNVAIRWNETKNNWQYTNNGADWFSIGFEGAFPLATAGTRGIGRLSVAAANAEEPVVVGDNDPRIVAVAGKAESVHAHTEADVPGIDKYTKAETDAALSGKAALSHSHADKSNVGHGHVEADISDLDKYTKAEVNAAVATKANVAHTHAEADVTNLDKYTKAETDAALAGKADTAHNHADKANTAHSHGEADISDLDKYTKAEVDTALGGKSNTGHSHTDKADAVHAHVEADITDLDKYTKIETSALIDQHFAVLSQKVDLIETSDIEVSDNTKGLIIKSPNGTRYRVKVGDDGTLSTELVAP